MRAMMRQAIAVLGLAAVLCASASLALAHESLPPNKPDSTELVNRQNVTGDITKGLYWNGKAITFHGEAIAEAMVRGENAWIHLNDDAYMARNVEEGAALGGYNSGVAVWLPASLTEQIDTYGDYQHQGAIVEVEGIFNGACREHGGDLDIHAASLKVLLPGHVVVEPVHPWKAVLAVVLSAAAVAFFVLNRRSQIVVPPARGL